MGQGGELSIRVARTQSSGASWVLIEVADTGPGMPDSVKGHIFEPFFTTKPTGSGLGLAICRSIVDAHRGSIRVENHRGQVGTTIVVELPVADAGMEALQSVAVVKDMPTMNPSTGTSRHTTD